MKTEQITSGKDFIDIAAKEPQPKQFAASSASKGEKNG